jgi:hypothetical protein
MSYRGQISYVTCCSTENIVSFTKVIKHWMDSKVAGKWVESYLRATLEVDGQKMPWRIVTAREAIAERLKDLEGNSDHHAERHEMQSALATLTRLEDEVSICPTAAITLSTTTLLPEERKYEDMRPITKPSVPTLRKAPQPPLSNPGATPDVDRAKKPPLVTPSTPTEDLNPGDRVEGLGNFGKPTGEIGTVERTNEDDALVKWDDDGRVRVGQPWLKRV